MWRISVYIEIYLWYLMYRNSWLTLIKSWILENYHRVKLFEPICRCYHIIHSLWYANDRESLNYSATTVKRKLEWRGRINAVKYIKWELLAHLSLFLSLLFPKQIITNIYWFCVEGKVFCSRIFYKEEKMIKTEKKQSKLAVEK